MTEANYTSFNGTISWKACNDNDRDVFIQQKASNYVYNTYAMIGGTPKKKVKTELDKVIQKRTCYEPPPVTKVIDPTEKNYHQINVQGRYFNNDNGNVMYFRDVQCHSYTFDSLPLFDPGAPSSEPSVSS